MPCVTELPTLEAAHPRFDAASVDLVIGALDDRDHAAEVVARNHRTIPVLMSDGAAVDPLAALGSGKGVVPFNVVLDERGIVLRQKIGTVDGGGVGLVRWAEGD